MVVRVNGNRVDLPAGDDVRRHRAEDHPGDVLSRPRAAIVVTGSELVRGDRQDRNGPFLAAEAVRLGLDPTRIAIVGDRVEDLERAFAEGFTADLCLVSGGLGPTHDDRTVELVARVAGRSLVLDEALEREIGAISRVDRRAARPIVRGVHARGAQAGDAARGRDLARARRNGARRRPRHGELRRRRPPRPAARAAAALAASARDRAGSTRPRAAPARAHHVLRFFGTPESAVAEALAAAGGEGDGVDVTICAREFEIHVDLFVEPSAEERGVEVATSLRDALAPYLFGEDERSVSEIVLGLCHARGLTLATAESCTGGMVASRLTGVPGSSEVFLGSVVAYANGVKEAGLGVPAELIAEHGAVSAEVAAAMAAGARERLGADVAVAVTGVAGPGGGTRGEARRPRLRPRRRAGRREVRSHRAPRRPRDDPWARHRSVAPPRASIVGESSHIAVTSGATVEGSDRIRLFVALEVPDDVVVDLVRWGKRHLGRGRPVESFHITLAFLGAQPRSAVPAIADDPVPRGSCDRDVSCSSRVRYRETRSVGMLVLADPSGQATSLADRVQRGLEKSRCVRARAPSVAAARHRPAIPRAARTRPAAARDRVVRSVRRRCFAFTPASVRGAVRGAGVMFARTPEDETMKREEALDVALGQIERQFGKGSVMRMSDRPQVSIGAISTGSLALDMALGIGGLPRGRVVEIFGPEASGKTTLVYHLIAEAQRRGGICAFIDAEHAMDPSYARRIGVDIDNLLVSQPDTGEQALEICELLIRSGALDIVAVDSVAALVPKAEIEGEMGDSHVGLQARLMSQALRKLAGTLNRTDTICIFTNQLREKIGVMFGNPETTPGGRALKFYSSVRLDIRRIETLKDGAEAFGNRVRVKVVKNKVAPPFKQAEFDIIYGSGIPWEGTVLDVALEKKVVQKAGSYFSFGDERLGQGRQNATSFLTENPDLVQQILTQIQAEAADEQIISARLLPAQAPAETVAEVEIEEAVPVES